MTREQFDKAMKNNDISWLIENTFMARIPDLVIAGMSIEDAFVAAKAQEDKICEIMFTPETYQETKVKEETMMGMCEHVYHKLRELPLTETKNSRWIECEKALGHEPTNLEFLTWNI